MSKNEQPTEELTEDLPQMTHVMRVYWRWRGEQHGGRTDEFFFGEEDDAVEAASEIADDTVPTPFVYRFTALRKNGQPYDVFYTVPDLKDLRRVEVEPYTPDEPQELQPGEADDVPLILPKSKAPAYHQEENL